MKKYRIYFAGPLFSAAERAFNVSLAWAMRDWGHQVWLPQENEPRTDVKNWEAEVFAKDVEGLDWADLVIANMDGPDPDSGTAWEVGYAYAKGKQIIVFRTDFRKASDGSAPYNIMLSESATKRVGAEMSNVPQLAAKLRIAMELL